MSDVTIKDLVNDTVTNINDIPEQRQVEHNSNNNTGGFNFDFLKAKTGEGSLEEYMDHPLNFNHSKATSRIIRGLSGLLGELDLAIVDIFVGALDLLKTNKSKGVAKNGVYRGVENVS